MLYTVVSFSRGMGLGNRLWPWSRCKIFTRDNNAKMLAPSWFHFRTAPFRMGGIDYDKSLRKILLYKNFISANEIKGCGKFKIKLLKAKISEKELLDDNTKNKIVVFEGYSDFFGGLIGHNDFLFNELLTITNARDRLLYDNYPPYDLALNIRCGNDFPHKSPISWYVSILMELKKIRPRIVCKIISDGKEKDVKSLTKIEGVELVHSRSAILDLLILTKAKLIIGSGGSSFTAWGSFLSGAQTWVQKGKPMSYFNLYNQPNGPVLYELDTFDDYKGMLPF
jgi:hypothetical protein